jgi:pimeloyl-ACP methyl ester carboxylesterase
LRSTSLRMPVSRPNERQARYLKLSSGQRIHLIDIGDGAPVLFLHGSGTSSVSLLPVLDRLEGARAIAVDRPGFGLSDPARVPRKRFRAAAVEFIDEVLDQLGLGAAAIAGNSMGGTWGLWYALAHPERVRRLVLLGSTPLLPGTRPPMPLRFVATPVLGELLSRLLKPNPRRVVQMMGSMGEGETIVAYPDLIEAVVAEGRDPKASAANRAELRAVITLLGFRRSALVRADELRSLRMLTLIIWGDRDPVGAVVAARETAARIPSAQLEVLSGGHVPYLGHPERVSELVSGFVRSE